MKKLKFVPFPEIKTERLYLRRLKREDAEKLYKFRSKKLNFPYVNMEIHDNLEQTIAYIEKINRGIDDDEWINWAINDISTKSIIGNISLWNFNTDENEAEVGYALFPENRGKGFMLEALQAILNFGFQRLKLNKIKAYTNKENLKSIALLQKAKFTYLSQIEEDGLFLEIYQREKKI